MPNKAFFTAVVAAARRDNDRRLAASARAPTARLCKTGRKTGLRPVPFSPRSTAWRRLACVLLALSVLFAAAAMADYRSGIDALNRGDHARALAELKPLAEKGDSRAQWALGYMYRLGLGVAKDPRRAQQWRERAVRGMLGDKAAPKSEPKPPSRTAKARRPAPAAARSLAGSATGILVDERGHVLTNAHVTAACKALQVRAGDTAARANVTATSPAADLALLTLATPIAAQPALFRAKPQAVLGEQVMIAGFPLQGLLSGGLQVGVGVVSALAGPRGDPHLIQIDASVLPGNSGGPVLDAGGRVIGVVAGVLRPEDATRAGAPWPPDIGFAVRGELVAGFLKQAGVRYRTAAQARADGAALAERAGRFTVRVECLR
jgi:S1-C subfamily serine protease